MANRQGTLYAAPVAGAPRQLRMEHYIGYLLRRAYLRAERAASIAVPPPYGMRHLLVLALLDDHGPMSQQRLAALARVNRTIMVQLVDALEDDGLVRRERDAGDRRSYALVLTAAGRSTLRRLTPAMDRAEALLTANLAAPERTRLTELLGGVIGAAAVTQLGGRSGHLIAHAHQRLRGEGAARLRPLGLDPRHLAALESVGRRQPCSQELVAKDLAVSAPVVVGLVDDLVAAGFVERRRNIKDRRRYDLTVTSLGLSRLRAGFKVLDEIHEALRYRLTPSGADELHRLLTTLLDPPLGAA